MICFQGVKTLLQLWFMNSPHAPSVRNKVQGISLLRSARKPRHSSCSWGTSRLNLCDLMWFVSRLSLLRTLSLKCPDIGAMCCMRTEPGSRGASQQLSTEPTPCLASTAGDGGRWRLEDWRIGGGSSMEHGLWRKLSFAAFLLPSRSHPCFSHWNFQKQNRMISRLIKRTKPTQSPCKQCQTRTGSLYGTSRHKVMEWGMRNHEKINKTIWKIS